MTLPSFRLDGRIALVTGASSGLGQRFAKVMIEAGATVGIAARRRDRLDELASTLGPAAIPLTMDVTDPASISAGLDALEEAAGGRATVIVNNAGIADPNGFLKAQRSDTEAVFATNQMAVFDVAQQAARRMIEHGDSGSIINISSITGCGRLAVRHPMLPARRRWRI